jgi:hypothetical protein
MLIDKKRALAYTAKCGAIKPIEGADNIELMAVNGWNVIVKKGEFKEGDYCVYFEIDSKLPVEAWSVFMAPKHYKVKTMKLNKFRVISQGLALPLDSFGIFILETENVDLTEILGVTYSVEEDNKRKAENTKYDKMRQRHLELFKKNKLVKWLYQREWGRKLLFIFLGKKKDTRGWPAWVIKTDEERCQNLPHLFPGDGTEWIVTEKIDGTSTTFTMKRKPFNKRDFYICSRNVVFDKPDKKCFYETNVYVEMAEKYNIEWLLNEFLNDHDDLEFVTLQGGTYGAGVQKREYSIDGHDFMAFNLIFGYKNGEVERFNPMTMTKILDNYDIPCVPIVSACYVLPATCEELLDYAASDVSQLDGGMREGIVLRTKDGKQSFKAVSNEFLLKYHG